MGVPQMLQMGILAPVATCDFICPRPLLGAGFEPDPALMGTPDCIRPVTEDDVVVVVWPLKFHVWALLLWCTAWLRGLGLAWGTTFESGAGVGERGACWGVGERGEEPILACWVLGGGR